MNRQILDAGDEVVINREGWGAQQATVIAIDEYGTYTLAAEGGNAAGLILHMERNELTRCNGDLQVGDWVRVKAESELDNEVGLIVDDYPETARPEFKVFVQGDGRTYNCRAGQLTRVARRDQQ